jgi:hypothetical protein
VELVLLSPPDGRLFLLEPLGVMQPIVPLHVLELVRVLGPILGVLGPDALLAVGILAVLAVDGVVELRAGLLGLALRASLEDQRDTDRETGATFDRQGRATRPVVDPRVSFRSAFLKPFRPLSRSTGEPCRQGSASSFQLSGGVPLSD